MTTSGTTLAFVAKLVAKSGFEQEVADLLTGALGLANDEAGDRYRSWPCWQF